MRLPGSNPYCQKEESLFLAVSLSVQQTVSVLTRDLLSYFQLFLCSKASTGLCYIQPRFVCRTYWTRSAYWSNTKYHVTSLRVYFLNVYPAGPPFLSYTYPFPSILSTEPVFQALGHFGCFLPERLCPLRESP